jgi:hypothetical protein
MSAVPATRPDDALTAVSAAQVHRSQKKRRLKDLRASASDIAADLETRRAALNGLAEDAEAFRAAVAYISAEEDRQRALLQVLIPEAELELEFGEHALDRALTVSARARAVDALERRMFPADQAAVKAMGQLLAALGDCARVRSEIRTTVHDPRSGIKGDALDLTVLAWGMPYELRAQMIRWPFAVNTILYKSDIASWHRERLGLNSNGEGE